MIKAVLLDMDNTLLRNPDGAFAGAFRAALSRGFADLADADAVSAALRRGIARMSGTRDMIQTNADVFIVEFAECLKMDRMEAARRLEAFYAGEYESLRECVAAAPGAREILQELLRRNVIVAIATNPLYPESAILARLQWAGLAELASEMRFITHSQNMHFIKPQPAYYAELLSRVGIEPDEALMIGDSRINDMAPAQAIGMHARRVDAPGAIAFVLDALNGDDPAASLPPIPPRSTMLKAQFHGNVAALYGLLSESRPDQWQRQPDPDEWSILQILCHLAETETSVHQARLREILREDNPFLRAFAPPGPDWAPCHDDAYAVLDQFRMKRLDTVALLESLSEADWQRPARHSIFGLTTLLEMAYFTAQHDRLHINQLCQTLGKCVDQI